MVEFYCNCSIDEATSHSPLEVMNGFQTSTPADRLLPLTSATAEATDKLTIMRDIRDCRRNEWQLERLELLLYFNQTTMSTYRRKV